jgi:hypothetical protein
MKGSMPSPAEAAPAEGPLLRPVWIIGVMGHRTLGQAAKVGAQLESELRRLMGEAARRGGELHVQVSADAGTDLLAIRAARSLGLPLHILLPLEEDEFFEGFKGHDGEIEEARAAIEEARAQRNGDTVQVAMTTGSKPDCYFDTDMRILETSDLLLTVWDGESTEKLGGVGQTAGLARAIRKPSIIIHPQTVAVIHESYRPETWPASDEHWDLLASSGIFSGKAPAGSATDTDLARSKLIKARMSELARADAFDVRRTASRLIATGALTGLVGLIAGILTTRTTRYVSAALYAVQLLLALWMLLRRWQLKRHAVLTQWTNARIGAEIWRGLSSSLPMADPLRPAVASLMPEWRRFALSLGLLINRHRQTAFPRDEQGLDAFKKEYLGVRLKDQRTYFTKELERSAKWARHLPAIAKRCSQAVPFFTILALLNRVFSFSWTVSAWGLLAFTILPAVLPLTASISDGMVSTFDHRRRSTRFRNILDVLTLLESELPHLKTEDSVRGLVRRTEELLLSEQGEWRMGTKKLNV